MWFVPAKPEHLGGGKSRQGWIASDLTKLARTHALFYLPAFRHRTLVVPQEGWPDHLAVLIQKDRPVHLSCKSNAVHTILRYLGRNAPKAGYSSLPPVPGILLRPTGPGHVERVLFHGASQDLPAGIYSQDSHPTRANVYAQEYRFS